MSFLQRFFQVRFEVPAFLGNADQNGQWRTPPFKAQLRHWWRMVWAQEWLDKQGYPSDQRNRERMYLDLRREEGLLFGNAWLENEYCKSLVRMRLSTWEYGNETKELWGQQELDKTTGGVSHPEVGLIGPMLYLGYGPLGVERVQRSRQARPEYATVLKRNAAIQAGEAATLSFAVPTTHTDRKIERLLETNIPHIERALWLMDRYGTVGGRSRNGWGSYALLPENSKSTLQGLPPLRPWRDCLNLDWPHAIGCDEKGPLIWKTAPHDDWRALMRTLAQIKIGLRTQFVFTFVPTLGDRVIRKNGVAVGINHGQPQNRHWLSYPVTHHPVQPWEDTVINGQNVKLSLRLPNQLRFKVRRQGDQLIGVIFHVPHLPPAQFGSDRRGREREISARDKEMIECVWECVHKFLDALNAAPSSQWPDCPCLGQMEMERRERLATWWSKVINPAKLRLERISE